MALFQECSLKCARKVLDTADIVREAILQQQWAPTSSDLYWERFRRGEIMRDTTDRRVPWL